MKLHPEEWALLPDGRRYQGDTDTSTMLPHGLGIIALDDSHFYAGEFVGGKRHGRGFVIERTAEEREEEVWVNGTYEEVMATAHFDNAGRAISYDNVGHYERRKVLHVSWAKTHDGVWENDLPVSDANIKALHQAPWKWAVAECSVSQYCGSVPDVPSFYEAPIGELSAEGSIELNGKTFVTPYNEHSLLLCSSQGHVFVLAPGDNKQFFNRYSNGNPSEYFSYTLKLEAPDYALLMSQCRFDDLVQTALTDDSEAAQIYLSRVFYTRCSIFMLSPDTIEQVKQAADKGNACAQFAYGRHLIVTNPNEQSKELSLEYFEKAKQQELPDAIAAISDAWRYGDFGIVDHSKANHALSQALHLRSEYAAFIRLKTMVLGDEEQLETALDATDMLIETNARRKTPFSQWLYFKGVALYTMGNIEEAKKCITYASNQGNIDAWLERAVYAGGIGDDGYIIDKKIYFDTLSEGAEHHSAECRTLLAWNAALQFDELPPQEQTPELAQEIIDELKECVHYGSKTACELLAEIHLNGWLGQKYDVDQAWRWYAQAAIWHSDTAYEKMHEMANHHLKDVEQDFSDMLALNGARLGSKKMLAATVAAYTHGRLTEYAGEIEQYYEPVFDNPAFTLDDDSPCPAADDDTDEYPDDDGRFDAWV